MTNPLAQDLGGVVLLPCPFCGTQPELHLFTDEDGDPCAAVECGQCYGSGPKHVAIMDDARPAAIAAWNRRTHSAEIAGALRDAERYRWLRDQASWWLVSTPDAAKLSVMLPRASIDAAIGTEGCDFDAAIDSAMQQGGGGG